VRTVVSHRNGEAVNLVRQAPRCDCCEDFLKFIAVVSTPRDRGRLIDLFQRTG